MKEHNCIIRPCKAGELSYISYLHCKIYEKEYSFDQTFEYYLLKAMAEYLEGEKRTGQVWVIENSGSVGGSIAMVEKEPGIAQLRWFLIIPELRSLGLGRKLMDTSLAYCRTKGYGHVFLWTVSHLEAARHLYEKYGFRKTEELPHNIWGQKLTEEKWDLDL